MFIDFSYNGKLIKSMIFNNKYSDYLSFSELIFHNNYYVKMNIVIVTYDSSNWINRNSILGFFSDITEANNYINNVFIPNATPHVSFIFRISTIVLNTQVLLDQITFSYNPENLMDIG